ncbi:SRPBCC family protein [Actinomadura craniellae]|uniref:SRPBCC family protein n=1 Tax=Actinomadura craniellae TaxID=2231787 RepID=A0A365H7J0_9ACTN|nr:SRPBCC family protein [Actinomadura craniellae]RAY15084.1 SRPBCC family protein [Actinomadura craniellae]
MPISIEATATSTASPEAIFRHVAVAEAWNVWGRLPGKARRERPGVGEPDGVGAVRAIWPAREEVVAYDPPRHYAYRLLRGLPVREYRADVRLESRDGGGTLVRWQGRVEPLIPGTAPLIRRLFTRVLTRLATGVAAHSTTCGPDCPAYSAP